MPTRRFDIYGAAIRTDYRKLLPIEIISHTLYVQNEAVWRVSEPGSQVRRVAMSNEVQSDYPANYRYSKTIFKNISQPSVSETSPSSTHLYLGFK